MDMRLLAVLNAFTLPINGISRSVVRNNSIMSNTSGGAADRGR